MTLMWKPLCIVHKKNIATQTFCSQVSLKEVHPQNSTSMENIKSWAMEQNMQHKIEVLTKRRFSKLFWSINLWTNVFWTNFLIYFIILDFSYRFKTTAVYQYNMSAGKLSEYISDGRKTTKTPTILSKMENISTIQSTSIQITW